MRQSKVGAVICISVILLYSSCGSVFHKADSEPITAVLGAFEREITMLEQQLSDASERRIEGIWFVAGRLRGRKVIMAWTGIGKVNATMTTTLLLEHFRPDEVIFMAIAGAVNQELWPGDIVIAIETAHHDMGMLTETSFDYIGATNPLDGMQNPVFLSADKRLVDVAEQAAKKVRFEKIETVSGEREPKIIKGVIVTGDSFIASLKKCAELRQRLGADAVEMEGAAVAQVCYQRSVPHIIIRGISDRADEKAAEDAKIFHQMVVENSASLVVEMVELLREKPKIKMLNYKAGIKDKDRFVAEK